MFTSGKMRWGRFLGIAMALALLAGCVPAPPPVSQAEPPASREGRGTVQRSEEHTSNSSHT